MPSQFRAALTSKDSSELFLTSVTGDCVRLYSMDSWLDVERKLLALPSSDTTVLKFLELVNYYGQVTELDSQGRVVIPATLRESASIVGEVIVFGRLRYLEVWNRRQFEQKMARDPWTKADWDRMSGLGF